MKEVDKKEDWQYYEELGNQFRKKGKCDQAIEQYQEALKLKPDCFIALYNLGLCYWEQKQFTQALEIQQQAHKVHPKHAGVLVQLAKILESLERIEEAIFFLEKAIEVGKKEHKSGIYLELAGLLFRVKLSKEAEATVGKAIEHLRENQVPDYKLFFSLPIIPLLQILLEAICNKEDGIQTKAIKIFASRSLFYVIKNNQVKDNEKKKNTVQEIKSLIKNKLPQIIELASSLDQQKSIELLLILSALGYKEIEDYYLNIVEQLLPIISLGDFLLFYVLSGNNQCFDKSLLLEKVVKALDNKDATYETAVIYSLLCYALKQQEEELSLLLNFIKNKGLDREISKSEINYQTNLLVALSSRLHTKAGTLPPYYPLSGYTINQIKIEENNSAFKKKTVKAALCISGQLRGFEKAFPAVKKYIIDQINPDIFVHTWEDIGLREPIPYVVGRVFSGNFKLAYGNILGNVLQYHELKQIYPTLFKKLCDQGKAELESLKNFFGTDHVVIENDNAPPFKGWPNATKMYYKNWKCSELMKSSSLDYDLVIKIRPDWKIIGVIGNKPIDWYKLSEECNLQPVVYVSDHNQGLSVEDSFVIGSMKVMDLYTSVYPTETLFKEKGLLGSGLRFHSSVGYRFWLNNIQTKQHPFRYDKPQSASLTNQEIWECLNIDIQQRQATEVDKMLLKAIELDLENDKLSTNNN